MINFVFVSPIRFAPRNASSILHVDFFRWCFQGNNTVLSRWKDQSTNGEKRRNLTIPSATANYFFFFVAFLSRRCYLIAFCLSRFSSCLDNQPFAVGRVASFRRSLKWTDSLLGVRDRSFEAEWMEIVGCAFASFGPCQFEFSTLVFLCFQIMVGEVGSFKSVSKLFPPSVSAYAYYLQKSKTKR